MTEPKYEETLLASVVIENDRQLALHAWKWTAPDGVGLTTRSIVERGWHIGLFDSDGNAIATLGRIEGNTDLAAIYESSAWSMFLAMVPRVTVERARNNVYFDLGSGPERMKA